MLDEIAGQAILKIASSLASRARWDDDVTKHACSYSFLAESRPAHRSIIYERAIAMPLERWQILNRACGNYGEW